MKGFSQLFHPGMKLVLVIGIVLVVLHLHLLSKHLYNLFFAQLLRPTWVSDRLTSRTTNLQPRGQIGCDCT
jgi:hypothetical protein